MDIKMSQELEDWIEKNNPFADNSETLVGALCFKFWDMGAKAMAEHIQSQPPTENNTKPSKEEILKVIQMLKNPCGAVMSLVYRDEETAEIILQNWNND